MVQTLSMEKEKVFVGRLDSNAVKLDHESVSRKHCLLRKNADGQIEVLDLNSRNGTTRNGESVERAIVSPGDVIGVGEVEITIEGREGELTLAPPPPKRPRGTSTANVAATETAETPAAKPDTTPAREKKDLVSDAHRTTFAEELFRHLRQAPSWSASVCLHALLVYLFFAFPFQPGREATPFGALEGDVSEDFSSLLEDDLDMQNDVPDDPLSDLDDVADPYLSEMAPTPSDIPEDVLEELSALPELGTAAASFLSKLEPSDMSTAVGIPEMDFGKEGAQGANERAGSLIREAMGRGTGALGLLKKLKKREILVVKGNYDHVQEVLELLGIQYELVEPKDLGRVSFRGRKALLVNCSNVAVPLNAMDQLRSFVNRGGYLLTTDWAVRWVIEPAFGRYIRPLRRNGSLVITPDTVVHVRPTRTAGAHRLLAGTALGSGDAKWWLEESSYPFEVLRDDVQVLIESDELRQKYGAPAVAATFEFGNGRVLHMLGHFFQKEGNLKGTVSTQRIIVNFLVAAIRGR